MLTQRKIVKFAGVFYLISCLLTPNLLWSARDNKDRGRGEQRKEKVQERQGGAEKRQEKAVRPSSQQQQKRIEQQPNRVAQRQRVERREKRQEDKREELRDERRENRRERIDDRIDRRVDRRLDRWDDENEAWRHRRYYRSYDPFVVRSGGYIGFTIRPRPYYYDYSAFQSAPVEIAVQSELQQLGYYGGPVDGDIGPQTRDAIRRYQIDNGLYPSGGINRELLDRLDII